MTSTLPTYAELLVRDDAPAGSSWALEQLGDLGTAGLLTPDRAVAGAAAVRTGQSFALNYPVDAFDPPLLPTRPAPRLHLSSRHPDHLDDHLDGFNPQSSSQIDGLRHRRHERWGFYNGYGSEEVNHSTATLGVQAWADRGLVGRAVLLDLQAGCADPSQWHRDGAVLRAGDLDEACRRQDVELERGDVLLLHTGWAAWYLSQDESDRSATRQRGQYTGVEQSREVLAWLWDHGVALAGSDTYAFERLPPVPSSPFSSRHDGAMMHQEMLALLGLAIGELWRLEHLAATCAEDSRWTCLLTAAPLNVVGGVSTPANALAIR